MENRLDFDLDLFHLQGSFTHQELSTCQVWSLWGKAFLSYQLYKVWGLTWPLTLIFDPLTWIWKGIIFSSLTMYLPSLKRSWDQLHKVWETNLTLIFDLLTWISIGIIYSSRTIYLQSLKLLGQSVLKLSVAQGVGIPTNKLTYLSTDICKTKCHSFEEGGMITQSQSFIQSNFYTLGVGDCELFLSSRKLEIHYQKCYEFWWISDKKI